MRNCAIIHPLHLELETARRLVYTLARESKVPRIGTYRTSRKVCRGIAADSVRPHSPPG